MSAGHSRWGEIRRRAAVRQGVEERQPREQVLATKITFCLPHRPERWRRVEARLRAAGGGEGRTVVSTPGPGWHEERVERGTRLVVRLEGERRDVRSSAREEVTIQVTGEVTDVVHLQLDPPMPAVLTITGVVRAPPGGSTLP